MPLYPELSQPLCLNGGELFGRDRSLFLLVFGNESLEATTAQLSGQSLGDFSACAVLNSSTRARHAAKSLDVVSP